MNSSFSNCLFKESSTPEPEVLNDGFPCFTVYPCLFPPLFEVTFIAFLIGKILPKSKHGNNNSYFYSKKQSVLGSCK